MMLRINRLLGDCSESHASGPTNAVALWHWSCPSLKLPDKPTIEMDGHRVIMFFSELI